MTIVFDSDKPASVMPCAQKYCGKVVVADIGIGAYADGQKEE